MSQRFLWSPMDIRKILFSNHFRFSTLLYLGGVPPLVMERVLEPLYRNLKTILTHNKIM